MSASLGAHADRQESTPHSFHIPDVSRVRVDSVSHGGGGPTVGLGEAGQLNHDNTAQVLTKVRVDRNARLGPVVDHRGRDQVPRRYRRRRADHAVQPHACGTRRPAPAQAVADGYHGECQVGGRRADRCDGETFLIPGVGADSQANVALPDVPEAKDIQERFKQQQYFMDQMFEAKTFAAVVSDSERDSR